MQYTFSLLNDPMQNLSQSTKKKKKILRAPDPPIDLEGRIIIIDNINLTTYQGNIVMPPPSPQWSRNRGSSCPLNGESKHTVEPLSKGHFGDTASVFISENVLFSEVKNVLMLW